MVGFFHNDYSHKSPSRPALGDSKRATFQAAGGAFLFAVNGGGGAVQAQGSAGTPQKTFTLERTASGDLKSGELVNLKAHDGHFMVAENRGGGAVNANRVTPLQWERFVVGRVGGAVGDVIHDADTVSLRSDGDRLVEAHGASVTATAPPGGSPLGQFKLHLT
jgi:hypothetical protein